DDLAAAADDRLVQEGRDRMAATGEGRDRRTDVLSVAPADLSARAFPISQSGSAFPAFAQRRPASIVATAPIAPAVRIRQRHLGHVRRRTRAARAVVLVGADLDQAAAVAVVADVEDDGPL